MRCCVTKRDTAARLHRPIDRQRVPILSELSMVRFKADPDAHSTNVLSKRSLLLRTWS